MKINLINTFLIVLFAASLGCNKNKNDEISTDLLVGKWLIIGMKTNYYNANDGLIYTDEYDENDIDEPTQLEFKANGELISTDPDTGNDPEIYEGKWKRQNGNELILSDGDLQFLYTVLNLTQTRLEIKTTETGNISYEDDDGVEQTAAKAVYTFKFKRI